MGARARAARAGWRTAVIAMTMLRKDAMVVDAMAGIGGVFVKLPSDVCAEGSVLQGVMVVFRAPLPL